LVLTGFDQDFLKQVDLHLAELLAMPA